MDKGAVSPGSSKTDAEEAALFTSISEFERNGFPQVERRVELIELVPGHLIRIEEADVLKPELLGGVRRENQRSCHLALIDAVENRAVVCQHAKPFFALRPSLGKHQVVCEDGHFLNALTGSAFDVDLEGQPSRIGYVKNELAWS